MRIFQSFLLLFFLALPLVSLHADEVDESFFVDADIARVRQVIHEMRKREFLRVPVFFLGPSLEKDNVFNGTIIYDRLTAGRTANINITAEEDGENEFVKVQVIGVYSGQFAVLGHGLVSNIEMSIRRKLY